MRDDAARRAPREGNIPSHLLHSTHLWPVVHWDSGRTMMIIPVEFTVENVHGEVEATRGQVRLFSGAPSIGLNMRYPQGTAYLGVGNKYPQVPRSNATARTD